MDGFETFRADAENCKKSDILTVSPHFVFSDFSLNCDKNTLKFTWTSLATSSICTFNYCASEKYPNDCLLHRHWDKTGTNESFGCTLPLGKLLEVLGKDLHNQEQQMMEGKNDQNSNIGEEDQCDTIAEEKTLHGKSTASCEQPESQEDSIENSDFEYEDCESDVYPSDEEVEDDYDFDPADFYMEMVDDEDQQNVDEHVLRSLHPLLRHDIQVFRDLLEPVRATQTRRHIVEGGSWGDRIESFPLLCVRLLETLGEVDCDIYVPLNDLGLSVQMAEAWRLNLNEPLVMRVNLSSKAYLDVSEPPKIEVFQSKRKCGIAPQLKNMLKLFLGEIWSKLDNNLLESSLKKSGSLPSDLSCASGAVSEDGVQVAALQHLLEMGFGETESRSALLLTKNNLMEASVLLSNMASCDETAKDSKPDPQGSSPSQPKEPSKKKERKGPNVSKRHLSTSVKLRSKKAENVTRSMSASHTSPNISEGSENPIVIESSTYLHAKKMPSLDNGFIVMLYRYICQRVPTVNEFCVVCDRPHVFHASGAMLMPSVCSRELCLFSFQTLGVMTDSVAELATGAEVVDLLVMMAKAACFSTRKALILMPFPSIVDPDNPVPGKLALSENAKDFVKVEALLRALPPMKSLLSASCGDIQKALNGKNKLLYPLLSWIIYSNRSHIVKLPKEKQLPIMATAHQFILLSSPPAQEKIFQAAKQQHGSCFAFHGSGIENWHSIIRQGLIVASGTKYQTHGAAYGAGIYLSPTASMSASYAGMGHGQHNITTGTLKKPDPQNRFLHGKAVSCMALCEVIQSPHLLKKNRDIWLCTNEDHVCTRFLFVYEDGQVNCSEVNMNFPKHVEMVEKALANSFMAVVPTISRTDS